MKQIIILLTTLALIIFTGIWEISYLKESGNYLLSDINNLYQIAERQDYELAKKETESVKENWKKIRKTWAIFIDDSKIDEIGDKMVSFVSYIENNQKEEIKHTYQCLSNSVKDIVEFECLNAENIF